MNLSKFKIPIKSPVSSIWMVLMLLFSCEQEMPEKYNRPAWLAGKLYTQILEQPELSTFAKCVQLAGYDSIINISGSYTVFAPSNEAFDSWLEKNPNFTSVESIPLPELTRLVKYHIIQNPWTKAQLRSLGTQGWIDILDENNNKPYGYKRESLLKEKDRKFGWKQVYRIGKVITDTLNTPLHRRVITDSRKYVPLFFQEYFNINDLPIADYEFYFNRSFEGGDNLYVANGKIVGEDIFAENGFVYVIDQVIEPLRSAYQILEGESSNNDGYSQFLGLINTFSDFNYNEQKTFDQEGVDQGIAVDSLFDLAFTDLELNSLTFNPVNERTSSSGYVSSNNGTIRYHHGLMAPTNSAFESLINTYLKKANGWGSLDAAPQNIRRIIANSHMCINPVYPSDMEKGFSNGELDIVKIDESKVVHKEYGSNCTFIGLNEAIVPRAFSSVTGPIYLQRDFSKIMYAIERTGLLPLLKRDNKNYMFFVEPDGRSYADSSLMYDDELGIFSLFELSDAGSSGSVIQHSVTKNDLRTLLLNHIAVENPKRSARKEFIQNMAGNYLIFNNQTGEVSGTDVTTVGYKGKTPAPELYPRVLYDANNGKTIEINNWFSFGGPTLYAKLTAQFPLFHSLLKKAGLTDEKNSRYSFISDSEFYTVFVPGTEAIESAGLNSMPVEQLKKVLQLHFVQGELIFTDGNKTSGYYKTARVDEKSTPYSTIYSRLFITPGIDVIRFKDKNGGIYADVDESEVTNILTGKDLGSGGLFPNFFNNAVIHEIDKVLIFEELDTQ